MGSGPSAHLHVEGTTPLHRMPAHAKLVGLLAFVLLVVSVPPQDHLALLALLLVAVGVLASTRVPVRYLLPRLAVELPFAGVRAAAAVRRRRPAGRARAVHRLADRPRRGRRAAAQGHLRHPRGGGVRRDDPAARPRARPAAPAGARHPRHHRRVHGALRRRRRRPAAPDAGGPRLARLHRPLGAGLAGAGREHRVAVHPQLRARRAGAPGDGQPRLVGPDAGHRTAHRDRRRSGPSRWRPRPSPPPSRWGCGSDERPRPRPARRRLRLPRWPPGPVRRRPARAPGGAGGPARPQRRRQDDAGAAPQRHPDARVPAASPSRGCR